jgi:hypothetical protein
VTKYLPWRAPLLVSECLRGCLGLSKGEPMTGSGFQHLATVRKIKSEMKLDSHRKNIASSVFRASFATCAFTFSTHHPHSTPHLAGSTTAMAALQFCTGGQISTPAYIPFPALHAPRPADPRKADLEGSNMERAEHTGEWIALPNRMAFCPCNSCNELQNL